MKKTVVLLILILFAGLSCFAETPQWKKYGSFTEIDVANIQNAGNGNFNYRFKINNTGNGLFNSLENGFNKKVAYTVHQENLNCKSRKITTTTIEVYGTDGKLIDKRNMLSSKNAEHIIKPGGGYEKLYQMMCK